MQRCTAHKGVDLSRLTALESIGANAFSYCLSLTSAKLGGLDHLLQLGDCFLSNCTALVEVDLCSATLPHIGD